MSAATKRVLPADVYDALELSALAYGGIGAGKFSANPGRAPCEYPIDPCGIPLCAVGHAMAADPTSKGYGEMRSKLNAAGILTGSSDYAVETVNQRLGRQNLNARVSFRLWARELGVERGT